MAWTMSILKFRNLVVQFHVFSETFSEPSKSLMTLVPYGFHCWRLLTMHPCGNPTSAAVWPCMTVYNKLGLFSPWIIVCCIVQGNLLVLSDYWILHGHAMLGVGIVNQDSREIFHLLCCHWASCLWILKSIGFVCYFVSSFCGLDLRSL